MASEELFLAYIRPHWRRLHQMAGRYAASGHEAHDLVQETLLRAWRSFSPVDAGTYERGWLFVILRNVAGEWRRTRKRRIRLVSDVNHDLTEFTGSELTDSLAPLPNINETRFREMLDARLAAAIEALDDAYREVLLLSAVGELTYAEIAQVLDCPIGTVMSRMARARRSLRERLADYARDQRWAAERQA